MTADEPDRGADADPDSGPEETDSGPEETDSGPEETDSGPEETDDDAGPDDTRRPTDPGPADDASRRDRRDEPNARVVGDDSDVSDDPDASDRVEETEGDGTSKAHAGGADEPRDVIRSLLELLRELEERDEPTRPDRPRQGPPSSADRAVSIEGFHTPGGDGPGEPRRGDGRNRRRGGHGRDQSRGGPASGVHVDTRETREGLLVVVDLLGGEGTVDGAPVDARIDRATDELVLDQAGRERARIGLEPDRWVVDDRRTTNGVVEITLRHE